MQATDILKSEHRVIEQVLDCLEQLAQHCARDRTLDRKAAWQAVAFFQTFADRCHHAKEEELLFPLLESKGLSRARGPTGVMLQEHELGRHYLRSLAEVIDQAAAGNPQAQRNYVMYANAYVHLLREHIAKEDQCLFPLADRTLTGEDQQALGEAFERVEREKMHAGTHEEYLRIANDLADRFGVARTPLDPVAGQGCCSCGHHG
jgi:hemerythrin-like domain-containing protein